MSDVSLKPPVSKVRLRFSKSGDMRFLSHHDLMRLLERLLRRAGLPFRSTEGFHPKAKITFASALSLGIVGREEVVEIELDGLWSARDVMIALTPLVPEGLSFISGSNVSVKSVAQPIRALYLFPFPFDTHAHLSETLARLLEQQSLVIDRIRNVMQAPAYAEPLAEERLDALSTADPVMTRVDVKKLDIRPFIHNLWRDQKGIWMDVAITNHGAIRPEELLRLVDLENSMLDGISVLERVKLFLEDEQASKQEAAAADLDLPPDLKQRHELVPASVPVTSIPTSVPV